MKKEQVFALDIGTRKILGLIMEKREDSYQVIASRILEHKTRAMLDGQIHNVEVVAQMIKKIKLSLEEELGIDIKTASVAAAGRALKTLLGRAERIWESINEFDYDDVQALELAAVQEAKYKLAREENESNGYDQYLCVGYSVVNYQLEEQAIGSLIGQIGRKAAVEVIATFLPRVVVDSLMSALVKADLGINSLTLEPIAALAVAIPENMRLLNLALVDVGAGTSDIAIVKDGKIYAYAMVPLGGDELTEHLARTYLMDFTAAEELKYKLVNNETIIINDILGNQNEFTKKDILNSLIPVVTTMANEIAGQILKINDQAPDAVICVGGGSLTPEFTTILAELLELPTARVGIKNSITEDLIICNIDHLKGPQGITPQGIGYDSFTKRNLPLIRLLVNNKEVILWNNGEETVAHALLNTGIKNIYGKPGMGKTIEINGSLKVFKGEMGSSPEIRVNGLKAELKTPVKDGDNIEFIPGTDGKDAEINLEAININSTTHIFLNNREVQVPLRILINGEEWNEDIEIPDRAKVIISDKIKIANILLAAGINKKYLHENTYHYYLNEQPLLLNWVPIQVTSYGDKIEIDEYVNSGAQVEYKFRNITPTIRDVLSFDDREVRLNIIVNGQSLEIKNQEVLIYKNEVLAEPEEELNNEDRLIIKKTENKAILSDIFKVFDIETQLGQPGTRLVMEVDGVPAGFTTPIADGSKIELRWE